MKKYSLVEDYLKIKFPFEIGQEIGYGAQGEVYDIKNVEDRVIKFSTLYDVDPKISIEEVYEGISQVYAFIIHKRPVGLVKIYEAGLLLSSSRDTVDGPQKYKIYYSIQEKLQPLTEDEKKVLKTVCQAHNDELDSTRDVEQMIDELESWFSFDKKKVKSFYKNLSSCPIKHNDVCRRNIMKDINGNFNLIDFDLSELK